MPLLPDQRLPVLDDKEHMPAGMKMAANIETRLHTESENAFEMLMNVTEESKNLRIGLKQKIINAVSMLRKSFSELKSELCDKTKELENLRRVQPFNASTARMQSAPSYSGHQKYHGTTTDSLTVALPDTLKRNYSAVVKGRQNSTSTPFKLLLKARIIKALST